MSRFDRLAQPLKTGWAILMVVVCCFATSLFSVGYTIHIARQQCDFLYIAESPHIKRPSKAGEQIKQALHKYRVDRIGCPEDGPHP